MMDPQGKSLDTGVEVPSDDRIQNWFKCHMLTEENGEKCEFLRTGGLSLARAIDRHCPDGVDKSAAIRKVREAVMTANAAIACGREA